MEAKTRSEGERALVKFLRSMRQTVGASLKAIPIENAKLEELGETIAKRLQEIEAEIKDLEKNGLEKGRNLQVLSDRHKVVSPQQLWQQLGRLKRRNRRLKGTLIDEPQLKYSYDSKFHGWFFDQPSKEQQKADAFYRAMDQLLADVQTFQRAQITSSTALTTISTDSDTDAAEPVFRSLTLENCGQDMPTPTASTFAIPA